MGPAHAFLRYWAGIIKSKFIGREMSIVRQITELAESLLSETKFSLYDVERNGGILKVTVDAKEGITLDELTSINRQISKALDEGDPMPNKYTLEVSSPGLERKLRTREHYQKAIGEVVGVKLAPHVEGERRFRGVLDSITDDLICLVNESGQRQEVLLSDISKAATVFQWKQNQKPGKAHSQEQTNMTKVSN